MPRYVAFLRAINVGGRTVRMEHLRQLFEANGLRNAATFIASGNVLFDSRAQAPALEKKIESLLEKELGYRVDTFIRPLKGLAAIAARCPFSESEGTVHVGFLKQAPDEQAHAKFGTWPDACDAFDYDRSSDGTEFFWLCRIRSSDSKFSGTVLEKFLRGPATLRNLKTLRTLAAMAEEPKDPKAAE